jgi:hypothetical protein
MPELMSVLSKAVQSKSILRIVVNLKPANADGLCSGQEKTDTKSSNL